MKRPLVLAATCFFFPTGLWALSSFAYPSGMSDSGVPLSTTYQGMTSYSGLSHVAGASPSNGFVAPGSVGFSLSQKADVAFEYVNASSYSPTGQAGAQFLFKPGALEPGETFEIKFNFDAGFTYGDVAGNILTTNQGGVNGEDGQVVPGGFSFSEGLAARTTGDSGPVSSPGQSIAITGVEWDGSAPDFSSALFGWTGSGYGFGNHTLYHWLDDGAGYNLSAGGSIATFVDDLDSDGLGAGFRDYKEHAWQSLSVKWTAGKGGLPADTVFRVSLDGSPIPEPSGSMLLLVALAVVVGRRRRR